ncbi:MAG TPA: trimethylamine methyltransferase family protein [Thermoleophilia bacterium]|nr:trimethylamine methyltransferase family protein [Thermoleophilia bacterium]
MSKATLTVWSEAECRRLHAATLQLLEEVGVEVMHEPALEMFQAAGATVQERRVRIPGRLVDAALRSAPRSWLLRPRGGDTGPLDLRDGEVHFGTGSDVLYVRDPQNGERRRARRADVEGMAALCEQLPNIDFVMSMGLPEDAPQEIDDLVQVVAMLRGTRKPLLVAPRDGSVLERIQEMATLCGEKESFAIYAMPSPPLMHDPDALTKVIGCARLRIPLIYASAPAAGATGPRSITGTVLVGNAETLSGLVLHQHAGAGAPFVYGAGGGAMNMRTMTDPYVSPDSVLALQSCTDLARHYGLPSFSYAGMSDSKTLDEQWSVEAALSMAYGSLSRATLLHDVGYLESGLQSSYESIVLGDELAGYARQFMREVPVDDCALAMDDIRAAGPGGNFLGSNYTRAHHREFWMPTLLDHAVHDRWAANGETTLKQRVQAEVARLRATERPFALTSEQDAALDVILNEALEDRAQRSR